VAGGRRGEGGAALEVGDGADGWAPSVGERERGGREGRGVLGRVGRKYMGRRNWVGFVVFFLFFLFFFKSIFKPISNLFKFKSFTCFQIQI
jgi:hypothetical protein